MDTDKENTHNRNRYYDERSHHRDSYHHNDRHYYGNHDDRFNKTSMRGRSRSRERSFEEDRRHGSHHYRHSREESSYYGHNGRREHHDQHPEEPRNGDGGRNRPVFPYYKVVKTPADEKLGGIRDDPRGEDPTKRITKKASSRGAGRNTESFDPASTLVRPDLRVQIGSPEISQYNKPLKHDDVVIVPELFGKEDDWSTYYQLVEEMRELQAKEEEKDANVEKEANKKGKGNNNSSKWISWHEGAHLISKNPTGSPTYEKIVDRLCEYFNIDKSKQIGTRFNWYRDSSDWKPFHHDSAAFNPQRARSQNITVGASFGAMRELAFIRAQEQQESEQKCKIYFPQSNNGVFSFGRDANILWKHGINALPPQEQDGKGRVSIILWGLAKEAIEEEGSPPLLGSDGKGPHAGKGNHHPRNRDNRRRRNGGGDRNHHDHHRRHNRGDDRSKRD